MRKLRADNSIEEVGGNGLLHRRALLTQDAAFAGAMSTGAYGPSPLVSARCSGKGRTAASR